MKKEEYLGHRVKLKKAALVRLNDMRSKGFAVTANNIGGVLKKLRKVLVRQNKESLTIECWHSFISVRVARDRFKKVCGSCLLEVEPHTEFRNRSIKII